MGLILDKTNASKTLSKNTITEMTGREVRRKFQIFIL